MPFGTECQTGVLSACPMPPKAMSEAYLFAHVPLQRCMGGAGTAGCLPQCSLEPHILIRPGPTVDNTEGVATRSIGMSHAFICIRAAHTWPLWNCTHVHHPVAWLHALIGRLSTIKRLCCCRLGQDRRKTSRLRRTSWSSSPKQTQRCERTALLALLDKFMEKCKQQRVRST